MNHKIATALSVSFAFGFVFLLARCGGGSAGTPAGDFVVRGSVASARGALRAGTIDDITHIVAMETTSQNRNLTVAEVRPDKSFEIAIRSGKSTILVFADGTHGKKGADMIVGATKFSGKLDTLIPSGAGNLDLTNTKVGGGNSKADSMSLTDLIAALGMTSSVADLVAKRGPLCLRYSNPDIDGDGVIDERQNFILDFHVRYNLTDAKATPLTTTDLAGAFPAADSLMGYTGTGVYAAWPTSYYPTAVAKATLTTTGGTVSVPGGPGWGDMTSVGPNYDQNTALPQGTYTFNINDGAKTFTYTNVQTPALVDLQNGTDLFVIFLKFNKNAGTCPDCTLSSIDYKWMKRDAGAWVDATKAELETLVTAEGGYFSSRYAKDNSTKNVGFKIPRQPSGTITWNAPDFNLDGITSAEVAAMKLQQVCHLGLSYDDNLGMRYFAGIQHHANCN